jgi:heterodisulfide reductase subunit C
MSNHGTDTIGLAHEPPDESMPAIWEKVRACMQCGTCTGSCGSSYAMDYTPRQMWRMVQLGMKEELFNSKTFWLCSSCYYCTLRCPRGLPLTETIGALKRLAIAEGRYKEKKSPLFYKTFIITVRRYGRVRELELMTRSFISLKNPVAPFGFTPLGVKLMAKGKISPQMPTFFGPGKLDKIFRKVQELEASS